MTTRRSNNYTIASDGRAITCHRCGRTSFNANDVAQRYCGHCHMFHDDETVDEAREAKAD